MVLCKKKYDWGLFFKNPGDWCVICSNDEDAQDVCRQMEESMPGVKFANETFVSSSNTRVPRWFNRRDGHGGTKSRYKFITYTFLKLFTGEGRVFVHYSSNLRGAMARSQCGRDGETGDMEELPLCDDVDEYESEELKTFLGLIP